MKSIEILRYIERVEASSRYDGRFKTIYALVCSLPDKELIQYVETHGFPSFYLKLIARRGLEKTFSTRQKNAVSRMLKQLAVSECKNKTTLRESLKSRFALVPQAYKKKILHCMLAQGTKKERLWAYIRLGWRWDDTFSQTIEQCYSEYHEKECAYLILNKFPSSFIYEHRETLAQHVSWRWVMKSTGKDYPGLIDRDKLTSLEWVHLMVDLHLTENRDDIEEYLYYNIASIVDSIISGEYHQRYPLSLRDLPNVNWTVWAMGQMGMADAIIRFQSYDQKFEHYIPEDIDDEKKVEMLYPWLCDVYDTFAVEIQGWPSREEKGYSLEQFLSQSARLY